MKTAALKLCNHTSVMAPTEIHGHQDHGTMINLNLPSRPVHLSSDDFTFLDADFLSRVISLERQGPWTAFRILHLDTITSIHLQTGSNICAHICALPVPTPLLAGPRLQFATIEILIIY